MSHSTGNLRNAMRALSEIRPVLCSIPNRSISISSVVMGKRNFRKFDLGNKRGNRIFKKQQSEGMFPDLPIKTEVKPVGFKYDKKYQVLEDMIPQFIVPDLSDCELKPYVSYRTADIYQEEFTTEDIFHRVYQEKIEEDFKSNKLDKDGNPLEPSEAEKLTPEEAWIQARKAGSDIFSERIPRNWECLEVPLEAEIKSLQRK